MTNHVFSSAPIHISLCLCLSSSVSQALKEIARVSEELCSYQDEIRKKSGDKR